MGYTLPFLTVVVAAVIGGASFFLLQDGELPKFAENQFWGASSKKSVKEDKSIRPFQLNFSEKVLTDLKTRLKLETETLEERVVDNLENVGFQWGLNKKFLKKVQEHWLNKYDWKVREALLNKYPNFKTTIGGLEIHFQHVKPSAASLKKYKKGTRPLLLLHGWPGSFIEFQKMIPLLVEPKDSEVAFELVIPSLPGYGFSDAARRAGLGPPEIAQIVRELMLRLGHQKFYVHGGDWGSIISTDLATMYKDNVLGAHMTMCFSMHPRSLLKFGPALAIPQLFLDEHDTAQFTPVLRYLTSHIRETGYMHLQATKPDSVGVALSYSPSGFAAYILEKFSFWSNEKFLAKEDGGILPTFNIDSLLDNVMVHWLGKSTTSSMRLYSETLNPLTSTQFSLDNIPVTVPVACRNYPHEILNQPRFVLTDKFQNLVRFTRATNGGHFSALEQPGDVATDIIATFNLIERK